MLAQAVQSVTEEFEHHFVVSVRLMNWFPGLVPYNPASRAAHGPNQSGPRCVPQQVAVAMVLFTLSFPRGTVLESNDPSGPLFIIH